MAITMAITSPITMNHDTADNHNNHETKKQSSGMLSGGFQKGIMDLPEVEMLANSDDEEEFDNLNTEEEEDEEDTFPNQPEEKKLKLLTDYERSPVIERYVRVCDLNHTKMITDAKTCLDGARKQAFMAEKSGKSQVLKSEIQVVT